MLLCHSQPSLSPPFFVVFFITCGTCVKTEFGKETSLVLRITLWEWPPLDTCLVPTHAFVNFQFFSPSPLTTGKVHHSPKSQAFTGRHQTYCTKTTATTRDQFQTACRSWFSTTGNSRQKNKPGEKMGMRYIFLDLF